MMSRGFLVFQTLKQIKAQVIKYLIVLQRKRRQYWFICLTACEEVDNLEFQQVNVLQSFGEATVESYMLAHFDYG